MSDNLHRHEMWGDDPEERDASEVVAEISSVDPEAARRWHDHPAVVPFKVVARFIARNGRRIAITVVGIVVLLAGAGAPGPPRARLVADLRRPRRSSGPSTCGRSGCSASPRSRPTTRRTRSCAGSKRRPTVARPRPPTAPTCPDPSIGFRRDRPHPHRHLVVDRPDAGEGRELLSARHHERRGAAEVLRVAVPAGRGRLHLLLPAVGEELGPLDRTDAGRLHVQHQGVLAPHEPSDQGRVALQRHQGDAPAGSARASATCTATSSPTRPSTRSGSGSATR